MGHDINVGTKLIPKLPEDSEYKNERVFLELAVDCFDLKVKESIYFGMDNVLTDEFYAMFRLACCNDGAGGNGNIVYMPKSDFLKWKKRNCTDERFKIIGDDGRIKNFVNKVSKLYENHDFLYWSFT